ncbi:MAG: metalloprotease [Candidatus Aenigmarchaeota archaeon]|nr:metalloprotease [Candidatus Aenigmarchaeota archaeon]
MRFSQTEIKDLLRAWLLISLAFAIAFHGFSLSIKFLIPFAISAFTAGIGFLLHELAHKAVAQKYGCWAEFRAFDQMLWLAVGLSFFGVIFAAPGAVMIRGLISARKHGLIALAGPATNIVLGLGFLAVAVLSPAQLMMQTGALGARINFWLGLFNMLPFMGLDGTKVLLWNKTVYALALILSIILVFGSSWII